MKLPSKKITLIACACILAVSGIYFALNPIKSQTLSQKKDAGTFNEIYLKAVSGTQSDVDTDADGLKDWEEQLWLTDVKKADTDEDGTNDGGEVAQGRNPAVASTKGKAFSDYISTSTVSAALAKSAGSNIDLTATDLFAREFFTQYLKLKSQGITIDSKAQQKIISDTFESGNFSIPTPKVYLASSINVSNQSDSNALREYGNNLGKILTNRSPKTKYDNEFTIFDKALKDQDTNEIKKLDPIITTYTGLLNDYAAMKVPTNALKIHLNLLNSMSAYLSDLKALRGVFEDPIVTYARLATFISDGQKMQQALREFPVFFNQSKVVFEQTEDGNLFLHSI